MEPHDVVRHRPLAFDKMEALVREMQDPNAGVPVRSQKIFLTSVPSAFMGYDLIEWLMERLGIEESEALNLANQLCQFGYFFPITDAKVLMVKDDSSLYRFQSPYYWPWQHRSTSSSGGTSTAGGGGGSVPPPPATSAPPPTTHPDNVEYAIYLCKRTKRNRQRHVLEDYEVEAMAGLKRNLQAKWDFINMQANEQVRLSKERKKGDKIVSDSQERAYWRVWRPPPGVPSALEACPVPSRCRQGVRNRRKDIDHCRKEVEFLKNCLHRTRVKMSIALDSMLQHTETFAEYDPMICLPQPSNPWVSEDLTYWQLNGSVVEIPTDKRVRRWALSMEELVADATGLQEFTAYLRKEYSHENIRFWLEVNDLRRSAQSFIQRKVKEIYNEFLAPGAPCEINIDGKTMEKVQQELKNPSRFSFDSAANHVYNLLLKKDCYPRFIRSEQYKNLLAAGKQPLHKKRFFGFGPTKKKSSTTAPPVGLLQQASTGGAAAPGVGGAGAPSLGRRRGSDRSLSGSAHELALANTRDSTHHVPHSHSQSNLSDIPYRGDLPCQSILNLVAVEASLLEPGTSGGPSDDNSANVCPWDVSVPERLEPTSRSRNNSAIDSCSSSSDISVAIVEVSERLRRSCGLPQQSTLDCERRAPPPIRRLSAFEPRRGPPSLSGIHDDFPHCSFDSSIGTITSNSQNNDNIRVDPFVDDEANAKKAKKAPSLLKSFSVSSTTAMVAPVISVSSAADDFPIEAAESCSKIEIIDASSSSAIEDVHVIQESTQPSTIGLLSSHSLTPSPLSPPSSVPNTPKLHSDFGDLQSKLVEIEEKTEIEIISETVQENSVNTSAATVSETVVICKAIAPLAESEDAAEEEDGENDQQNQQKYVTHPIEIDITTVPSAKQSHPKDEKGNDICPWEDEETCKMDTPFVKTYATLGYL